MNSDRNWGREIVELIVFICGALAALIAFGIAFVIIERL